MSGAFASLITRHFHKTAGLHGELEGKVAFMIMAISDHGQPIPEDSRVTAFITGLFPAMFG